MFSFVEKYVRCLPLTRLPSHQSYWFLHICWLHHILFHIHAPMSRSPWSSFGLTSLTVISCPRCKHWCVFRLSTSFLAIGCSPKIFSVKYKKMPSLTFFEDGTCWYKKFNHQNLENNHNCSSKIRNQLFIFENKFGEQTLLYKQRKKSAWRIAIF